ncbi:leucine-rich repeat-containing protein 15 [Anabrus simplex]|uniref:leucine-rich repeat-containing protein 15 n=1 Tax=Anabrus simplex TaxID=316456 RepID=UPI0035A2FAEB
MDYLAAPLVLLLLLLLLQGLGGFPGMIKRSGCNEMNGFCSCVQEFSLQCVDMGIDSLSFLRENLQNDSFALVSLSYNNISEILNGDLPFYLFTELVVLHMDHNAVSEIQPQAFEELPALRNINLSFNRISNIHSDTFRNNTKLRELGLSQNYLTSVDFVRKVPSLQYLFLDGNKISILPNKTFSNSPSSDLYLINLRNNSLQTIEPKAFYGLTKLQFLLLEGNSLTVLHPGTFRFTPNLRYLHADRNRLANLSLSHNTINLREGFFSQNNISVLTNDIFSGSSVVQLEELNLENNSISIVRHRAFQRLQRLWKLNLSGNNISLIYPDTFQNTTCLSILDVSNNLIDNLDFKLL